jgi:hypothetical protein
MLGSVLVWDRDPLHLGSYPKVVVAEGEIVREQKFS